MFITYDEAKLGMRVNDRSVGNGTISAILKTRIKVRFDKNAFDTTYDKAHIKICLTKIIPHGI